MDQEIERKAVAMILPYKSDMELSSRPILTQLLLMANIVGLAITSSYSPEEAARLGYDWGFVSFDWTVRSLFTHIFIHADGLHLLGNMLFLWIFAPAIEEKLGKVAFLPAYLMFGVIAAFTHGVTVSTSMSDIPAVGASGAISGLMGAYIVLYPRVLIRHVFIALVRPIFFSLPAWIVLGMWLAEQFFYSFYAASMNVAIGAHIGGFAAGAGFAMAYKKLGYDREGAANAQADDVVRKIDRMFEPGADPGTAWSQWKSSLSAGAANPRLKLAGALAALRVGAIDESRKLAALASSRIAEMSPDLQFDLILLRKVLGEEESTAEAGIAAADHLARTNHWQEAMPIYGRLISDFPDHPRIPSARLWVAQTLFNRLNQPDEARAFAEAAAVGDHRSALVQEARYLLERIERGRGE